MAECCGSTCGNTILNNFWLFYTNSRDFVYDRLNVDFFGQFIYLLLDFHSLDVEKFARKNFPPPNIEYTLGSSLCRTHVYVDSLAQKTIFSKGEKILSRSATYVL